MSEMTDLFGSLDISDLDEIAGKLNVSHSKAPEPQQVVEEVNAPAAVKQKERGYVKFDSLNEQIADLFDSSEIFPEEHISLPTPKPRQRVQVKNKQTNNKLMEGASRAISHTVKNQPKYEAKPLREQQSVEDRVKLLEQDIFRVQAQATPNTLVAGIGASLDSGGGSVNLWDLDDVNIGAPLNGKYPTIADGAPLVYDLDTNQWIAGGAGLEGGSGVAGVTRAIEGNGIDIDPSNGVGEITISLDAVVTDLRDVTGTPVSGSLLIYDGTNWDASSLNTSQLTLTNPQGTPFTTGQYSRASTVVTGIYTTQEDANNLFSVLINDLDDRVTSLDPESPGAPGANDIGNLDDVDTSGVDEGDFLVYNGGTTKWNASTVVIPKSESGTVFPERGTEKDGDIFFKTDEESIYIFTTVWTKVSSSAGGASVAISANPPDGPSLGDLWVETDNWSLYVYDGYNWVGLTNNGLTGASDLSISAFQNLVAVSSSWEDFRINAASYTI